MLREALEGSGLFVEGTEYETKGKVVNSYYGFNVTKVDEEPIDQIHGFIAAKRIQERNKELYGETGNFYPFIAGVFEVLNARNDDEIRKIVNVNSVKDQKKKSLFGNMMKKYDIRGDIRLTQDLWKSQAYWEIMEGVFKKYGFDKDKLFKEALRFYDNNREKLNSVSRIAHIPPDVMNPTPKIANKIGNWPAAILYTPAEISEALYFSEQDDVSLKIGHMEEKSYDKYIREFMDIVHLRQPTDLASKMYKTSTVTPYLEKHRPVNKIRIYFNDNEESIFDKLSDIEIEDYLFTIDPRSGELLNPIIEKVIYAVECARMSGEDPPKIGNVELYEGKDVLRSVYEGKISVAEAAYNMPNLVDRYILEPLKE